MSQFRFSKYSDEQLETTLMTSLEHGLTTNEAKKRLSYYGLNFLPESRTLWFRVLINQFRSPFIYLLIFAALISLIIERNLNTFLIFLIILLNAFLGFIQEYRAEKALRYLKQSFITKAQVKRDNKIVSIDSRELVPGDIIFLKQADYIPADIRFIESNNIIIDESTLTGESTPVKKIAESLKFMPKNIYQTDNLGFLGSTILTGSGIAVVFATGLKSQFGKVSQLVLQTKRESGFQQQIAQLSKFLLQLIIISLFVFLIFHILIIGTKINLIELSLFAITLAIGVTPEALPVVTTFALSKGALKLAKNNVLVKRLSAIEDLGNITTLCIDKTGTVTQNKLDVTEVFKFKDNDPLLFAILATPNIKNKNKKNLDPFDLAFFQAANQQLLNHAKKYKQLSEVPFTFELRKNLTLLQAPSNLLPGTDQDYILISRGAYEEIIKNCHNISNDDRARIQSWIEEHGRKSHRIIAVATKILNKIPEDLLEEEKDMEFGGLIAIIDPLKPTAKKAIEKAHKLKIEIKMLTGDGKEVAKNVAQELGMLEKDDIGHAPCVITGNEFQSMNNAQKLNAAISCNVFARITPQQKYEIVNLLKPHQNVGFLGEGINDAPALKASHVALVVQKGADIAKEAADIILLQKSLTSIVDGIAIGREVFANTIKYIKTTLSSNLGNFYSIVIASLLIDFLPMLPLQILLVNLLSDFPMISMATDNVDRKELSGPQKYDIKDIAFSSTIFGLISSIFDFMIFALFYRVGPKILQTNWFITSILTELTLIFSLRTKLPFYKAVQPSFTLVTLSIGAFLATLILPFTYFGQEIFKFERPSRNHILILLSLTFLYFITTEIVKLLYYKVLKNNKTTKRIRKKT